ncbi:Tn3 family transposase [Streptomyces sp. NBC_01314]|uniref:Tn3 family transposase n=1 Tax=Streptomyces sp. NBC_01314 TaxID=2903821 RepID=UPI00352DCD02
MIGAQLNITEARHRLARKIFFGQRGELRQHYREGMEDQLTELPGCEPKSARRSTHGDGPKHQAGQLALEDVPHHRPDVLSSRAVGDHSNSWRLRCKRACSYGTSRRSWCRGSAGSR